MAKIIIHKEFEITPEQMADLMVAVLEGGINYWCGKAIINKEPEQKYDFISEVIGIDGELKLYDAESNGTWILTQKDFLKGVTMEMENNGYIDVETLMDNHDADTADNIIQFALFNEIIFG